MTVTHDNLPLEHSNDRFRVKTDAFSFHRQYSQIYAARFTAAKPILEYTSGRKWHGSVNEPHKPNQVPIRSLADLVTDQRCVIIGTIYKDMKLKPSILRDLIASETASAVLLTDEQRSLLSSDDSLYLEDDVQRILIKLDRETLRDRLSPGKLATGVVMALLGYEPENSPGSFVVEDFLFLEPQPERPIVPRAVGDSAQHGTDFARTGPWLAVVSGLGFTGSGPSHPGHAMCLQLLADWLRRSGDWGQAKSDAAGVGVVRLLILGDSIRISNGLDANTPTTRLTQQARYLTRHTEADSVTAMSRLDQWLATLPLGPGVTGTDSNGLAVDLLPGPADPTSQLLPQQPIHAAAFPLGVTRSAGFGRNALCGRTNPYSFTLVDRKILATSGQGPNDLALYTDIQDPCERMEATLLWGHLAPTCPDTLPGYPMISEDQLLLRSDPQNRSISPDYPDIYLCGCQPGCSASWRRASLHWASESGNCAEGALLVAVPRFDVAYQLVLVHLNSLECRVIRFDSRMLDTDE